MEQATGEVEKIFWGGNVWGNNSAPPLAPCTLGIPRGAAVIITQQVTTLPAGGNAPMTGKTAHNLHGALMGVNPTLNNTVLGSNVMGAVTGTVTAPLVAPEAGKKE